MKDRGTLVSISDQHKMGDAVFGVYRTHEEFVQAALQAKHPIDFACSFPELLVKNIAKVLNDGPKLVNARRKLEVLKVKKLAVQLESEEQKLHQQLNPEMAKLLEGKRLLLWKELMLRTGYDDPTLFDEMLSGFKLVGQAKVSPQFPRGFSSMQQSPEELRRKSLWMRKANLAKCKSSGRKELDKLVWQQTLEECDAGWMHGPYDERQISDMVGSNDWLATRRFPLEQKDKTRLIDDALASGLNSAYGTSNKLTLFDIDTLVAMVLQAARAMQQKSGTITTSVYVSVSALWSQPLQLVGRTLDLQSAYKQDLFSAVENNQTIGLWTASSRAAQSCALITDLAQGAGAGVKGKPIRSRLSDLAHSAGVKFAMDAPAPNAAAPAAMNPLAPDAAQGLLTPQDWQEKTYCARILLRDGSEMEVQATKAGMEQWRNLPKYVAHTAEITRTVIKPYKAEEKTGIRSEFYSGNMHGWDDSLKPELAVACLYARVVLQNAQPRTLTVDDEQTPVLVFSDGAWEPGSPKPAGAGLVIVDPITRTKLACEVAVPGPLVDHWRDMCKSQIIAELELLPVVVFFSEFGQLCRKRRVLVFVDNNAIRDSVAKGTSKSLSVLVLLSELHRLWNELQCLCWISRVPTKSNIGDLPSRQQPEEAARIIGGQTIPPVNPSAKLCNLVCGAVSFVAHMKEYLK
ncbi:unnamed protein product [Cladocopium goreaui]|uniref:Uncharacterized protein n=1 Tax=Cladocopium goreaui TaxID=2562237 RepID=A0A9P1GSH6_9DINO|nr:unnamed protein product [Cladocopium goreaui]